MSLAHRFAHDPNDPEDVLSEKVAIFLVAASCCVAGLVWSAMYWAVFGWGVIAALPLSFTVIVGASLALAHFTKAHRIAVYAQLICIIYVTALIQWNIGGLFESGFVLAWAFCGPVGALFFFSFRRSIPWFLLYLANLVITVVFDDYFAARGAPVSDGARTLFFVMNLSISSLVVFVFAGYFVNAAATQRKRADALLLNILPREIAPILKSGQQTIAQRYDSASVLFADIVGSTPLFAGLKAEEVVDWLNEIFSMFDRVIERNGAEKIRTIGDNYMVAAGVPTARPDHAEVIARVGLEMARGLEALPPRHGRRIQFRLGIHSGPLVAGVIGESKFQYDLWGDTVNVAARMESHGEPGRVQISDSTRLLIEHAFECECRGTIPIKGRGEMLTWFLVAPKASTAGSDAHAAVV